MTAPHRGLDWWWRNLDVPHIQPREALLLITRYALAALLFRHGMSVVFPPEITAPDAVDWVRPWGEFNKCEIMRLSFGYPPIYTLFTGFGEAAAGIMLLFQRTTLLGAMVGVGGMTNVAMLEFSYCGVAAAAYGASCTALAGCLIMADWSRFSRFFLFGRPTTPALDAARSESRQTHRLMVLLQACFVSWLIYSGGYSAFRVWAADSHMSSLRGVYRVESFTRNGDREPLAYEWPQRWRLVAIDGDRVAIRTVDRTQLNFRLALSSADAGPYWNRREAEQTASLEGSLLVVESSMPPTLAPETMIIKYIRLPPDRLELSANFGDVPVTAELRRIKDDSFEFYQWLWRK